MRTFLPGLLLLLPLSAAHAAEPEAVTGPGQPETLEQHAARLRWFTEARFGMFIHWGVYAVFAGEYQGRQVGGNGEWIYRDARIPTAKYRAAARNFTAARYDPAAWARLARDAGMKYVVITSKHHDGFALYDSRVSAWNAVAASGAGRDLIAPLAQAVRGEGLKFGLYYSQGQDWTHRGGNVPDGMEWNPGHQGDFDRYLQDIALPQVEEILRLFHPDLIWWDSAGMTRERTKPFAERVGREIGMISNDRLGPGFTGDTMTPEQQIPPRGYPGKLFEVCMTMNGTWGYKRNDQDWKSARELIRKLSDIASKGGNFLLNVGPTAEGEIPAPSVERLQAMGRWLRVNGEAIYGTAASPFARRLPWGRVTRKATAGNGETLYLHVWEWPADGTLLLPGVEQVPLSGSLLADGAPLAWRRTPAGLVLTLPGAARDPDASVAALAFAEPVAATRDGYPAPGSDGRIALDPRDADFHGFFNDKVALTGSGPDAYLVGWRNWEVNLEYQVKPEKEGVWMVSAEIAAPRPAIVHLRGPDRPGPIVNVPQGDPGAWRTTELGRIRLPAGLTSFRLIPDRSTWSEVGLRRVWLTPVDAPADDPLVPQATDGGFRLTPDDALIGNTTGHRPALHADGGERPQLAGWSGPGDVARWPVTVDRPGAFAVRLTYALDAGADAGFTLTAGGRTLTGGLPPTAATFTAVDLGRIELAAGRTDIALAPRAGAAPSWRVRLLEVVPVAP